MATLKKLTRMGADVRQIARLLQAKAPEGHMLAYITPDEAKLLKSQGGSGKEHENTGVPSFENEYDGGFGSYDTAGFEESFNPEVVVNQPENSGFGNYESEIQSAQLRPAYSGNTAVAFGQPAYSSAVNAPVVADRFPSAATAQADFAGQSRISEGQAPYTFQDMSFAGQNAVPGGYLPTAMTMETSPQTIDTAKEQTIGDKLQSYYKDMKPETLQRLGLAGGLAALGAYQSNKATRDAEKAKKEQQALAAPYQQKGAELQRAAQAGELTPVGQQQLQAVQAQVAQQSAGRGGAVSAAQSQAQIEAFRGQLLQQQYDYGLKMSGIGDNIALGAIKTGLEADRYVQQLSNSFIYNVANIAGGMPAQSPQQYQQRTA